MSATEEGLRSAATQHFRDIASGATDGWHRLSATSQARWAAEAYAE